VASDENKQELRNQLTALVAERFAGDSRAAFAHYDSNHDGLISKDELKVLLSEAGVGSRWTRWAWAAGIVEELDENGDGLISWTEFAAVFEVGEPTEPDRPRPSITSNP